MVLSVVNGYKSDGLSGGGHMTSFLNNQKYPIKFPMGKTGASVGQLTFEMLKHEENNAVAEIICSDCGNAYEVDDTLGYVLHASDPIPASTSKWIGSIQKPSTEICGGCSGEMIEHVSYAEVPKIIILEYPYCNTETSHKTLLLIGGPWEGLIHAMRSTGPHPQVNYIISLLDANPALYLDELQDLLEENHGIKVSLSTLSRTLRHTALTHKRVAHAAVERNKLLRATWQAANGEFPMEYFVWLDEASMDDRTNQ
ncbi:uncharacterized protein LACBIDRAFT_328511 [Laccaria bicolor S238N-H82]|uniref:Predicted protein n=1 Tax=Laccaria bicolor (strain S238N-H82 / ATCC MYA-4686) TaxID=486041 RepID=B0DF31_LACBS|nr:uncharacterized protein LACBIDRAFT_328511 [Laccaria bicolor S238N-H82]EDR06648.1 predicted protein [Laccaria bicolor S238N-H82]|eukprot:XP_001882495.1 predicted protein [Laccaria bicolor S238N-H82]